MDCFTSLLEQIQIKKNVELNDCTAVVQSLEHEQMYYES